MVQQVAPIYQTGDSQVVVYDFANSFMYVQYPSESGYPTGPMLNITKVRVKVNTTTNDAARITPVFMPRE